jgi:folate-dependent phosphoribosylglycinamide formyltransferase PurN
MTVSSKLRVVFISNCKLPNHYLVKCVGERWPLSGLIRPSWTLPQRLPLRPRLANFLRHPLSSLSARLQQPYYNAFYSRLYKQVSFNLYGSPQLPPLPVEAVEVPYQLINKRQMEKHIRDLKPDVLIVSGGPVLKSNIFSIPRMGTLNVHWGICPFYRGEHTLFWPLLLEDYEKIGLTVHYVDEGIDTGSMLARGYPALSASDTEAGLYAKCSRLAAELIIDILQAFEARPDDPPEGKVQENLAGKFIRFKDRTILTNVSYSVRRHIMGKHPPEQSARIEKFWMCPKCLHTTSIVTREKLL